MVCGYMRVHTVPSEAGGSESSGGSKSPEMGMGTEFRSSGRKASAFHITMLSVEPPTWFLNFRRVELFLTFSIGSIGSLVVISCPTSNIMFS